VSVCVRVRSKLADSVLLSPSVLLSTKINDFDFVISHKTLWLKKDDELA
jgi:hypothetical protein